MESDESFYKIEVMKIVELIYSIGTGGAERFVVDMCNRLAENENDEVVLLTVWNNDKADNMLFLPFLSDKVRFENLGQPMGFSMKILLEVYRFLKRERADVVHCHSILMLLYLPALLLKGRYYHTLHSTAEYCLKFRWLKGINRFLYRRRVQPVTITDECSHGYRNLYGLKNDAVIENGRKGQQRAGEMPEDMKKGTDGYTFVHVANCLPMKNQERLFRVFSRMQDEGVAFDLFCFGADYDEYQERFEENRQIHVLGLRSDVSPYLSFADFMVLSSDFEGMPVSIIEGLSLGVVPISTPAGGVVDMIRDGENGYLADGFDDEQLYNKVMQAIREHGKIERSTLQEEFERKYSIGECVGKYYRLYVKANA